MKTFIHHPFHKHGLILREMSDKCSHLCFICNTYFMCEDKHVRGRPTYCCEECGFFIHSSCADLPLEIHHPSHPNHPLVLSEEPGRINDCGCINSNYDMCALRYSCDNCVFRLCVRCAIATLPPPPAPPHPKSTIEEEEEEEAFDLLEHFISHEHPLTSLDVKMLIDIKCWVCDRKVVGPVYGCPVCFFLVHRSCTQLLMQHPLHPQHPLTLHMQNDLECRACGQVNRMWNNNYKYCCDSNKNECGFTLHASCAASTLPPPDWKRDISLAIQHFSHHHPLVPFPMKSESDIKCYICEKKFKTSEVVYGCLDCILFIHKQCTELPQQQVYRYHTCNFPLTLLKKYKRSKCKGCSKFKNFVYHCESCDKCVCIKCVAKRSEIEHFGHDQYLTLPSDKRRSYSCAAGCKNTFDTQFYTCNKGSKFDIHKSCAELLQSVFGKKFFTGYGPPLVLEDHPLHPSHSLTGVVVNCKQKIVRCSACLHQIERFMFQCAECDFNLDIHCASMTKPTICHQPHKHKLTYFPSIGYESTLLCNYCGITCKTDLYRCVECNFNIHHDCSSLPLIVKDEHHYDPLSLCEKDLGDQADRNVFYCDRCELNRDPDLGVYTCEETGYIAHIYCIVPKEREKRKKVVETMHRKWDTQISKKDAKLEEAKTEVNKLIEELKYLKTQKEQEIIKLAIQPQDME